MRSIKNRVNNNAVSNSTVATKPASVKPTKPAAKPKETEKPAENVALTAEQTNRAKAVKYIMEHLNDPKGNQRLEIVQEDGNIFIDVLDKYRDDEKLCKQARFSIITSARILGLKWNTEDSSYEGMTAKEWNEAKKNIDKLPAESSTAASVPAEKPSRKSREQKNPAASDASAEKVFTAAEAKARALAMLNYLLGDGKAIDVEKRTKMVDAAFKIA